MYQIRQTKGSGFFSLKLFCGCSSKSIIQLLVVNEVFEFATIIIWGGTCPFIARPEVSGQEIRGVSEYVLSIYSIIFKNLDIDAQLI